MVTEIYQVSWDIILELAGIDNPGATEKLLRDARDARIRVSEISRDIEVTQANA
ncbi:hypothetical protein GF337_20635 [candidate division KSB1 bacterium]|nr:hypothetical protein [candidate division KSB1 bacterium]